MMYSEFILDSPGKVIFEISIGFFFSLALFSTTLWDRDENPQDTEKLPERTPLAMEIYCQKTGRFNPQKNEFTDKTFWPKAFISDSVSNKDLWRKPVETNIFQKGCLLLHHTLTENTKATGQLWAWFWYGYEDGIRASNNDESYLDYGKQLWIPEEEGPHEIRELHGLSNEGGRSYAAGYYLGLAEKSYLGRISDYLRGDIVKVREELITKAKEVFLQRESESNYLGESP